LVEIFRVQIRRRRPGASKADGEVDITHRVLALKTLQRCWNVVEERLATERAVLRDDTLFI
jgi:hypothetical protein